MYYFEAEILAATKAKEARDIRLAWVHLERAHILGQRFPWLHLRSHFAMLRLAIYDLNSKEIIGQFLRVLVAYPASLFSKIPIGNTGRAHVGMRQVMLIPEDLKKIIDEEMKIKNEKEL